MNTYRELTRLKKRLITMAVVASMMTPGLGVADDYIDVKKGGAFFGSAIAGALIAGPVGFVAGALGGAWLGEEVEMADQYQRVSDDLFAANNKLSVLNKRLLDARKDTERYGKMALGQLELDMLFKTNMSELTLSGKQRMIHVVEFLKSNPGLSVRLDGYSDPRGDAGYNLLLSTARVDAVADHLLALGLGEGRITRYSHGAEHSSAQRGDLDGYALERFVRIQLFRNDEQAFTQASIQQ